MTLYREQIATCLARIASDRMKWLERVGPDYRWILNEYYGDDSPTMAALAALSPWALHVLKSRKDQALYLLGIKPQIHAQSRRAADNRLSEFQQRQRLTYIRDHGQLSPGDRSILNLALVHGAIPLEIARRSRWTVTEVKFCLNRLIGSSPLQVIQPGERVRRTTFRRLLKDGCNPKAKLELSMFEELARGIGVVELASQWQVSPFPLSTLTTLARQELADHPATASEYGRLERRASRDLRNGPHRTKWLNAEVLPLYCKFRRRESPFSTRETRYLRARTRGRGVAAAGKSVFALTHPKATIIDRAFMDVIRLEQLEIPDQLPLPPFTGGQLKLMRALQYTPM